MITEYPNGIPRGVEIKVGDRVRGLLGRWETVTAVHADGTFTTEGGWTSWRTWFNTHEPVAEADAMRAHAAAEAHRADAAEAHRATLREMNEKLERERDLATAQVVEWKRAAESWKARSVADPEEVEDAKAERDGWRDSFQRERAAFVALEAEAKDLRAVVEDLRSVLKPAAGGHRPESLREAAIRYVRDYNGAITSLCQLRGAMSKALGLREDRMTPHVDLVTAATVLVRSRDGAIEGRRLAFQAIGAARAALGLDDGPDFVEEIKKYRSACAMIAGHVGSRHHSDPAPLVGDVVAFGDALRGDGIDWRQHHKDQEARVIRRHAELCEVFALPVHAVAWDSILKAARHAREALTSTQIARDSAREDLKKVNVALRRADDDGRIMRGSLDVIAQKAGSASWARRTAREALDRLERWSMIGVNTGRVSYGVEQIGTIPRPKAEAFSVTMDAEARVARAVLPPGKYEITVEPNGVSTTVRR